MTNQPKTYADLLKAIKDFKLKFGKEPTRLRIGKKAFDELARDLGHTEGSLVLAVGNLNTIQVEDENHFEVVD